MQVEPARHDAEQPDPAQLNVHVAFALHECEQFAMQPVSHSLPSSHVVVHLPLGEGQVVLFAINPIWRGETIGSYFMVWNAILNFDALSAGRKVDAR